MGASEVDPYYVVGDFLAYNILEQTSKTVCTIKIHGYRKNALSSLKLRQFLWRETLEQEAKLTKFTAKKSKKRKPGTGCISKVSKNTWQGKYTPRGKDGKRE